MITGFFRFDLVAKSAANNKRISKPFDLRNFINELPA
jgi:hypothetical protein